ncbi:hypothetical protein PR202_gb22342 [Eleusine coracana subsp. coracana]|uniref:Peroxidase n=1 Tax=Eleusine coracana subsp. coracana TaxID=191504 RepID=A0AAV5FHG8_ELECO|nr:hypothetical protein PR202_gb22342 [Eleusine coracana subsp. coracana]
MALRLRVVPPRGPARGGAPLPLPRRRGVRQGAPGRLLRRDVPRWPRTSSGRPWPARKLREARSVASVMRLQFHDCFVNGCDGSVLMDPRPGMEGEKDSLSNINSLRSFDVVDEIKAALEDRCPGVVSCADIIVMAARDAVVLTGGPNWAVRLGRDDSLTASHNDSDNIMPSPRANASTLIRLFAGLNLSITDLVALSGSHSIGKARCFSIVFRLYNQSGSGQPDPNMDMAYRSALDTLCPQGGDEEVTGGLDATPRVFDNQYFKDLVALRGFLNSDQTLFSDDVRTQRVVKVFSSNQDAFFKAIVEGMVKMGEPTEPQDGGDTSQLSCRQLRAGGT